MISTESPIAPLAVPAAIRLRLVGLCAPASGKLPDLPLDEETRVEPVEADDPLTEHTQLARIEISKRRTAADRPNMQTNERADHRRALVRQTAAVRIEMKEELVAVSTNTLLFVVGELRQPQQPKRRYLLVMASRRVTED